MNLIKKTILSATLALSIIGLTVSAPVEAKPTPNLISITVNPESAVLGVDQQMWFYATGNYSDGSIRSLPTTKGYLTSTVLESGMVLITGGYDGFSTPMSTDEAELYDPATGVFSRAGSMTSIRDSHGATRLVDGTVLITGGWADAPIVATAEVYNPTTGKFRATGSMVGNRAWHTSTLLPDGKVLVSGGVTEAGAISTAEVYNPATGTFSPTGSMSVAREEHEATLLANGTVLITGGGTDVTELYDPATSTFNITGLMTTSRYGHSATLLADGKVLVAGGWNDNTTAELYDPATGTFSAVGSMSSARAWHTATLLSNNQVLLAGDGTSELYDPATNTFTAAAPLVGWRYDHTAALLNNGSVLAVGGGIPMAELYNPQTGVWQDAGYNLGDPLVWSNSDPTVATAIDTMDGWYYLTGLLPGTTTLTATSGSISGSAQVKVGYAPTAFVAEQIVAPGEIVQLNGSATDSDGYIASYVWYQSYGVPVVLSDSFVASPSFTAPPYIPGDFWGNFLGFQLNVTDNDGLMATTYASVQIAEPTTSSTTSTSGGSTTTVSSTTTTTTGQAVNCGGNVGCNDAKYFCAGCHGVIVSGIQAAGSGGRNCVQRTHTEWTATIERMNAKGCGVPSANVAGIASYLANLAPIDTTTTTTTTTTSGGSTTTVASTTTTTLQIVNCGSDAGCQAASSYCSGCHNGITVNGHAIGGNGRTCVSRGYEGWVTTIQRMNGKGCGVPSSVVSQIATYLTSLESPYGASTTTTSGSWTTTSGAPTTTTTLIGSPTTAVPRTTTATTGSTTTTSTVATATTTTVCNTQVNGTTNYPYSGTGSCHGHGGNNSGAHTVREEKWCQQHMDHFNSAGNHTHALSHPICM